MDEMNFPVVSVKWLDHYSVDEWDDVDEYFTSNYEFEVTSTGYLIAENDNYYFVANSVSTDKEQCCGVFAILKAAVREFNYE